MAAKVLSGKSIADQIKAEVLSQVEHLHREHSFSPTLVVIRVGNDAASSVYVKSKVRAASEIGIVSEEIHLPVETSASDLLSIVKQLNERNDVDAILVQLPLPSHINEQAILESVDPDKDVDGFHPLNSGRLMQGQPTIAPCTPAGVIEILKRTGLNIAGANAVVIGRSNIVGKPMAMLLLKENATVTICHSKTKDLSEIAKSADILIAAIGKPGFVNGDMIREGAIVVDVGINKVSDRTLLENFFSPADLPARVGAIEKNGFTLVGDVSTKDAQNRSSFYTPVPGGVGLLTVAMLMKNTVSAALNRRGLEIRS